MTMLSTSKKSTLAALMGATAIMSLTTTSVAAQDCRVLNSDGSLQAGCAQPNAGDVVDIPVGVNTEPSLQRVDNNDGFVLSIDGVTLDGDPRIEDRVRQTDLALADADIRVTYDGLDVRPRLDVRTVGGARAYNAGDVVTLQSRTNYPAFIDRGELRIFASGAGGNRRLVSTVPIDANGQASIQVPGGEDVTVVHRVYDANGRYNETEAVGLSGIGAGQSDIGVEEGTDRTATSNFRVSGGAVTVSASNVVSGGVLQTLGESIPAAPGGNVVIQRILPPGDYAVDVAVQGSRQNSALTREITVEGSEWFQFGVADLTFSGIKSGRDDSTTTQTTARLTYYVDGKTANGTEVTASVDTGEEELSDIFRRLDERDPRSVAQAIDPNDGYLTYGDDSTSIDNTPTSGKFYVRIQRDGNFALWGDYQATVDGSGFLRNERSLYGFQAQYNSPSVTANGDATISAEVYAAQPDQLVGRETFRGTGGSVYFLDGQAITVGTETITIESRDATTNRVLERRTLVAGRDYDINYLQGVIVLKSPLSGEGDDRLIRSNPGGDVITNLVAQYEFTPTSGDVDGFSVGGRVEAWVTDDLRFGATALRDTSGIEEDRAAGVDLRYLLGANSYVQLDYARSEGRGIAPLSSVTAGLVSEQEIPLQSDGEAYKVDLTLDLQDFGLDRAGTVTAYAENRTEGFSTLDFSVGPETGDETLYGFAVTVDKTDDQLGYKVYADLYENDIGDETNEYGAEVEGNINSRLSYAVGVEVVDKTTAGVQGDRLDVGARLDYDIDNDTTVFVFGQATADDNGLDEYNRLGVGATRDFGNGWSIDGDISDGTGGVGARVVASYDAAGTTYYFGYELDPGRAIDAGLAGNEAGGRYVAGGRRQVTNDLAYFGENTYDVLGERTSLTSVYGAEYQSTAQLTYTGSIEVGQVEDGEDIIDQMAVTFGVLYDDGDDTTGNARIEYRIDDGELAGVDQEAETIAFIGNLNYKIDEEQRVLASATLVDTESDESSLLNGSLYDVNIGYALRPINDERLNVLARYRYFEDSYGQTLNGVAGVGAVQESHVVSIEGSYDLDRFWTLGAKVGGRFTESAEARGEDKVSNDAWLVVANARYNVVHNWDVLLEARRFEAVDAGFAETSLLGTVYRHFGNNAKVGVGYNFGSFSDDLTDLEYDDQGLFLNIIAKF